MHTVFGRILKYILWIVLVFIVIMLLIGLAKFKWNLAGYVDFLNTRDRSQAWHELRLSRPSSFGSMFWGGLDIQTGENMEGSGDMLSGSLWTGESLTEIDAYDPELETELNSITDLSAQSESGYGFVTGTNADTLVSSGTLQEQLLKLIRQRELKQ